MTTDVQDTQAAAAAAKNAVDQAEADLVSGKRSVSAAALHKLRDGWRYAGLSAERARREAEESRRKARLDGLAGIGAEVDKLAQPEHTEQLAEALRDAAVACARFRALADAHDADVADLVAAATALDAEPAAPAGPRGTSSYVAVVKRTAITHKSITVSPIGDRLQAALQYAMNGDVARAVAEIRPAARAREARRPDHVLRNVQSGMIIGMDDPLHDGIRAQLRSGALTELSDYDVDRYMKGELA